jgi:gluconolactonase
VDLASGKVEVLYTECNGHPLRGPNDIVFDSTGGFWFTDFGKVQERQKDRTAIYYAKADGSLIKEMIFPIDGPNGIGLAPDDTHLYVAQTFEGRCQLIEDNGNIRWRDEKTGSHPCLMRLVRCL